MATPLRRFFSTNEKIVSQRDDQALEATTKILIISFDQEKFGEILPQGGNNPLSVRKHRKITLAKVPLVVSFKSVSFELT